MFSGTCNQHWQQIFWDWHFVDEVSITIIVGCHERVTLTVLAAKNLISEAVQSSAQPVSAVWHVQKGMHVLKTLGGHEL